MSKKKKKIVLEGDPLVAGDIQDLPEESLGDGKITITITYDSAVSDDAEANDALRAAANVYQ